MNVSNSRGRVVNNLPKLKSSVIFAMTIGMLGVTMAFSLQSSMMGRIFQTLGADPNKLGWFFILPPLAGMIIQPLIGKWSDRTWNRFGRRMPYLLIGGPMAAIVLVLLPNAGSFGFGFASLVALWFGAIATLFMDLASNICMQPYKMIIGDMVNEDQKDKAWSWQQIFCNVGALISTVLPFALTAWGVPNTAPRGEVPPSVKIAYYVAAAAVLIFTLWTVFRVHEYNPKDYAKYHGLKLEKNKKSPSLWHLTKTAPKSFWEVGLTVFFTQFALLYLWTYTTGAISTNVWHTDNPSSAGYQAAGNWYGVLYCILSITGVLYGLILAKSKKTQRKFWYRFSLFAGGIGFISIYFIHNKWLLILSFILIGMANFIASTEPFAIFTESLSGNQGSYLGLFNVLVCVPQIVASVVSFWIFPLMGKSMPGMLLVGGIALILAGLFVSTIRSRFSDN